MADVWDKVNEEQEQTRSVWDDVPLKQVDNSYLSNAAKAFASGNVGILQQEAQFAPVVLGTDGASAKFLENVNANLQRDKEWSLGDIKEDPWGYATDPSGITYGAFNQLGSSAQLLLQTWLASKAAPGLLPLAGSGVVTSAKGLNFLTGGLLGKELAKTTGKELVKTTAGKALAMNQLSHALEGATEGLGAGADTLKETGNLNEARMAAAKNFLLNEIILNSTGVLETNLYGNMLNKLQKNGFKDILKAVPGLTIDEIMNALQQAVEEGTQNQASLAARNKASYLDIINPFNWTNESKSQAAEAFIGSPLTHGMHVGGIKAADKIFSQKPMVETTTEKTDLEKFAEWLDSQEFDEQTRARVDQILSDGSEEEIEALKKELNYTGQEAKQQTQQAPQTRFSARKTPIAEGIEDTGLYGTNNELKNGIDTLNGWVYNSFGKDMLVSGGARSEEHNKAVGGDPNSEHLYGEAVDLDISEFSEEERKQIEAKAREAGFNTLYHDAGTGYHLHLGLPKSGKFNFEGMGRVMSFADMESEVTNLYGGNDYLTQQMAEIDKELAELNKKQDATADDFLRMSDLQNERQQMQAKIEENKGLIKEIEASQETNELDVDNADKAEIKARQNYTARQTNNITQKLKSNNKYLNGIQATIKKNKGKTTDKQKAAIERLTQENKDLIEKLRSHKERATNLQSVYDERYKAQDEAEAKTKTEEQPQQQAPIGAENFDTVDVTNVHKMGNNDLIQAFQSMGNRNNNIKSEIVREMMRRNMLDENGRVKQYQPSNIGAVDAQAEQSYGQQQQEGLQTVLRKRAMALAKQQNANRDVVRQQVADMYDKAGITLSPEAINKITDGILASREKQAEAKKRKEQEANLFMNEDAQKAQKRKYAEEKLKELRAREKQLSANEKIKKIIDKAEKIIENFKLGYITRQQARDSVEKLISNSDLSAAEKETLQSLMRNIITGEAMLKENAIPVTQKADVNKVAPEDRDVDSPFMNDESYEKQFKELNDKIRQAAETNDMGIVDKLKQDYKVTDEYITSVVSKMPYDKVGEAFDEYYARGKQKLSSKMKAFINGGRQAIKTRSVSSYIKANRDKQEKPSRKTLKALLAEREKSQYDVLKEEERQSIISEDVDLADEALKRQESAEEALNTYLEPVVKVLKAGGGHGVVNQHVIKGTGIVADTSDMKGKDEGKKNSASFDYEFYSLNSPAYRKVFKDIAGNRTPTLSDYREAAKQIMRGESQWANVADDELKGVAGSTNEEYKENSEEIKYLEDMVQIYCELAEEFSGMSEEELEALKPAKEEVAEDTVEEKPKKRTKEDIHASILEKEKKNTHAIIILPQGDGVASVSIRKLGDGNYSASVISYEEGERSESNVSISADMVELCNGDPLVALCQQLNRADVIINGDDSYTDDDLAKAYPISAEDYVNIKSDPADVADKFSKGTAVTSDPSTYEDKAFKKVNGRERKRKYNKATADEAGAATEAQKGERVETVAPKEKEAEKPVEAPTGPSQSAPTIHYKVKRNADKGIIEIWFDNETDFNSKETILRKNGFQKSKGTGPKYWWAKVDNSDATMLASKWGLTDNIKEYDNKDRVIGLAVQKELNNIVDWYKDGVDEDELTVREKRLQDAHNHITKFANEQMDKYPDLFDEIDSEAKKAEDKIDTLFVAELNKYRQDTAKNLKEETDLEIHRFTAGPSFIFPRKSEYAYMVKDFCNNGFKDIGGTDDLYQLATKRAEKEKAIAIAEQYGFTKDQLVKPENVSVENKTSEEKYSELKGNLQKEVDDVVKQCADKKLNFDDAISDLEAIKNKVEQHIDETDTNGNKELQDALSKLQDEIEPIIEKADSKLRALLVKQGRNPDADTTVPTREQLNAKPIAEKPAEEAKRFDKERAKKGLAGKLKKKVKNAEPQANDAIKIPKFDVDESELDALLKDVNKIINRASANVAFDPELAVKMFKIGVIYIKKGFNTFADWSNIMLKGIPNGKPFLKATWNSIKGYKSDVLDGETLSAIVDYVGAELDDGKSIEQIKKDLADEYEDDLTAYIDSAYIYYKDYPSNLDNDVVESSENTTKEAGQNATDRSGETGDNADSQGTGGGEGELRERDNNGLARAGADRQTDTGLEKVETENVQAPAKNGDTEGESDNGSSVPKQNPGKTDESGNVHNGRKGTSVSASSSVGGGSGRADRGTGTVEGTAHVKQNYHIDDPNALLGGTPKVRFLRNQKAIEAVKAITDEGRDATEEEKAVMAAYSGWGSFGQELFQGTWERPIYKDGWKAENDWLRNHLGKEEWESAQKSIINAHYTDPITVKSMWDMISKMGFKGGRILEPSMGVGNFFALMPKEIMANSTLTGIELDTTTGKMAQALYPNANIQIKGYQDSKTADNFYDLIIGNVPFHAVGPSDRRYNKFNPTLHDYFFLKGLDQLRPGGLMVAITSKGTMDKADRKVRGEMAKKAELVAAFRLPTGAFDNFAGTSVVTDILIFKKRENELGNEALAEPWVDANKQVVRFKLQDHNLYTNNYFKINPDNVLGKIGFGHGTTTNAPGLLVERQSDFQEKLENLKDRLEEGVYKPQERKEDTHYLSNHTNAQQGSVVAQNKGLYVVQGEMLTPMDKVKPYSVKNKKQTEEREKSIKSLTNLRDILGKVIDADNNGDKNAEELRKQLNQAYDNHKKEFGNVSGSWALGYLEKLGEPSANLLGALEDSNGNKVGIFKHSTVRAVEKPKNPSIEDAFIYNRNNSTTVDIETIANDSNSTPEEVAKKLIADGMVFKTPAGNYETKDQYLSGNVRIKLREAQDALNSGDKDMEHNVEELKKVIPATVPYYNIEANLGASWIDPQYYKRFIADKLGLSKPDGISLTQANGGWVVKFENKGLDYTPLARSLSYGDVKFSKILEKAFNHQTITIKAKDDKGNEYADKEASEKAQAKVDEIVENFKDWLWQDNDRKVQLEKDYNEAMNAIATPKYDGSFMQMSGMALLRGNNEFSLRTHQSNAIYRGIVNGRGIYAHEVGTGKTYTMGGLAIESRKYGLAKKPLILAHNANSNQVYKEIQEMYPGKKILYIDNLDKATIKKKLEQIKVDDWDAIVIPHSQMEKFTLKEETLMRFAADEIAELEDMAIAAAEEEGEKLTREKIQEIEEENLKPNGKKGIPIHNPTAKKLVGQRNRIIENIRKQAAKSSAEDAISFEDLGIDMIIVDEAHVFKKPPFSTKMSMKGLNNSNSQAGIRLNFLCRYVQSLNNGKGVHLFTGTPITNTLAEMFHMMRYVMPNELKEAGVYDFDRWFNVFAAETNDLAITSSGEYENESRLASFTNVAELRRMAGSVMDIVFADDMPEFKPRETESGKTLDSKDLTDKERDELLNGRTENAIGRPYKKIVNIEIPLDSNQKGVLSYLVNLAKEWKQAGKEQRKEWMKHGDEHSPLLVETAANNAGLDARLYNPNVTDDGTAKEAQCVKNVIEIFRQGDKEHPAVQAIFMERGFSNTSTKTLTNPDGTKSKIKVDRFNMAKSLKEKIAKEGAQYGLTEDKIVIIDGTVKAETKAELAEKLAKGELYVVIGSTQTLGTGVNMQANLRAMHHLDAPWTPAELEQRNGRGHRQGNKWNTVLELRYLAEKLDGKRWQVLSIKQKFIKMFMKADENLRTIEGDAVDMQEGEGGSDLQETLSKAAGDPRIMLKAKYEGDIKKLQQKERIFVNGIADTKQRIKETERTIEVESRAIPDRQKDADTYNAHKDEPFEIKLATTLKPGFTGRKTFDKMGEANEHLQKILREIPVTASPMPLGTFKGFNLRVVKNVAPIKAALDNKEAYQYDIYIEGADHPFMAKDSVMSIAAVLRNQAEARLTETVDKINKLKEQLEIMKKNVDSDFPQKESLEKRKKLLADLEADLKENPTPAPQWLIQGSPVDNDVYYQGEHYVVTGHKANNDGFYVTGINDNGKTVNIPYQEAKDEHNMDLYDALQHGFSPEYGKSKTEKADKEEPQFLITNDQLNENTPVEVTDVSDGIILDPYSKNDQELVAEVLNGYKFNLKYSNGIGIVNSINDGKHILHSSAPAGPAHNKTRLRAISVAERVLKNAIYVDKHDDVEGSKQKYIELYAAVKNKDQYARLRIVAKELDTNAGEFEVVKAGIYDIIKEGPSLERETIKISHNTANEPSTISLADLLTGVKDRKHKPYVTNGKLNFAKGIKESQNRIEANVTKADKLAGQAVINLIQKAGVEVVTDKAEMEKILGGSLLDTPNKAGVQYLKTKKGEVYGFTKNGVIYIDTDLINANTPIHEYVHIWDEVCRKRNPALWRKGVALMKQTPLWDEVKNNPSYANIKDNENLLASEVHARLTGEEGEKVIKQIAETTPKGIIAKLKEWLKGFWFYTKDVFHNLTGADIERVTLKDWQYMPMADLEKGTKLGELRSERVGEGKNKKSSGTFFSGGGLVDYALKSLINGQFAVEFDKQIAGVYEANNGPHMFNMTVQDFQKKHVKNFKGTVDYFHASPVCKNFSMAKVGAEELPLDIETAQATADAIRELQPKVFTLENVPRYAKSQAMSLITKALEAEGYNYDIDVYDSADYGAATSRKRVLLRAVKDGLLPPKPQKTKQSSGWYNEVKDLIPSLPEVDMPNWMAERLGPSGIDLNNITKPLLILHGTKGNTLSIARADEIAPALLASDHDQRIVMPGGKIYRATPRVLARITGLDDDYKLPSQQSLAYRIIGNGVPVKLTQAVFGPLLEQLESNDNEIQYQIEADRSYVSDLKRAAERIVPIKTEKVYRDTQDEYDSHAKVGLIHNNGDTTSLAGIVGMHIDREKGITRANKTARNEILAKATANAQASLEGEELGKFYGLSDSAKIKRGVAAFMRAYARDKKQAQQEYPAYYGAFEKMLAMPSNKMLKNKVDNFVETVQKYEGMTEEGKARASKSKPKANPTLWDKVVNALGYSKWFDDKDAINDFTKKYIEATHKAIEDEDNPYYQARLASTTVTNRVTAMLAGPQGKQSRDTLWKTLNSFYDNVMKNKVFFSDVIAKANELNEKMKGDSLEAKRLRNYLANHGFRDWNDALGTYLLANRFMEIWKTKPNYTASMTQAQAKRMVDFAPKEIKEAAELYYKFDEDLLRIMKHDGLLSQEAYDALTKYKAYCPLFRDFADDEAYDKYMERLGDRNGFANISNGIKYLTEGGSDRTVMDDPVISMMRMTGAIISKCERNKVGQKLVALTKASGIGEFAMPAYDAEGNQLHSPNAQESRFTVYEDGVKNAYRTTPELYKALTGNIDYGELVTNLVEFLSIPSQALRFGSTSTPGFMANNAFMDTATGWVFSRNNFIPVWGTLHGMYLLTKDEGTTAEYKLSGAAMGTWRYQDRTKEFETLDEMAGRDPSWYDKNAFTKLLAPIHKYFMKGFDKYLEIGELVENSNRIEEYYLARKKGKSTVRAALEAKEITTDFTRGGEYGRVYNRITPFFNARLQGLDQLVRNLKERPAEIIPKMAALMLMAAIYWSRYHDEDWWKEKSNEEKMSAMFLPYKDEKGHIKMVRMPYPHELGLISSGLMIMALEKMNGDNPDIGKNFAQQIILQTSPAMMPAFFRPLIEVQANYDLYFNSPIETKKDEQFLKEARIGSTTSKVSVISGKASKAVTDVTGGIVPQLSPKEFEHLYRGYVGDAGRILIHSLDDEQPGDQWLGMPILGPMAETVRKRFIKKGFDHPKSVDDWYNLKTELEQYNNTYLKGQKPAYMQGVNNVHKAINKINKQINAIRTSNLPEDRKQELIYKLNVESSKIARIGLKTFSKYKH